MESKQSTEVAMNGSVKPPSSYSQPPMDGPAMKPRPAPISMADGHKREIDCESF